MIRSDAAMSVTWFAELVSAPRRTYCWRLARHRVGNPVKGPWPALQVDRIELAAAKLTAQYPAWGHRKIGAMGHYKGWDLASPSSMHPSMARRGLPQPVHSQAEHH